ncbi:hypothetical protein [Hymenobacter cellulosilyticus]|uniref:hypothetical protein n=1 Tax=Hymenobacter cellulosilyticus TaxID=2932248 RepID=UPI0028803A39|nr:hypothetical protein [Hymenobacter cellulosilyticus]
MQELEQRHTLLFTARRQATTDLVAALQTDNPEQIAAAQAHLQTTEAATQGLSAETKDFLKQAAPPPKPKTPTTSSSPSCSSTCPTVWSACSLPSCSAPL